MYFRIYRLPKKWLDKCIKTPVSEEASTNNIVNRPKHTCILGDSTFTIFIEHFEGNWVRKSLFWIYAKS